MIRNNHLPMPQFASLNLALVTVSQAFGAECYLVGSAVERRDFRDVDVRMPLDDDQMKAFFGGIVPPMGTVFGQYMAKVISADLSAQCGLPVDFQFQERHVFRMERDVNMVVSMGAVIGRVKEEKVECSNTPRKAD